MSAGRTPPKVPRPTPAPLASSPLVEALVLDLAAAPGPTERDRLVAAFWAGVEGTPVLETASDGRPLLTFLWRDAEAAEVLLFVNRLTDERDLAASLLRRVPGTDIFHLTYALGPRWRGSYSFLRRAPGERAVWLNEDDQVAIRGALDHGLADPLNPETTRNRAGIVQSVAASPAAPAQPWLGARADVPRGTLDELLAPGGREAWLYTSAGAAGSDAVPLAIVLDGEVWTGPHDLPTTLDNLVDAGLVPPLVAVFLHSGGRDRRWSELDEHGGLDGYVAGPLLDWARETAAGLGVTVSPHADRVLVAGQSLGALTSLRTVVLHPDRVGLALSQSASLWQQGVFAEAEGASLQDARVWLEVGEQEWVLRPHHAPLANLLRRAGARVDLVEFDGGHDYACWRGGIADGLVALLG
ncbi:enterochelin esterase domain-containing protein [Tessaracoccus palaemonis]|uniref:DUF3327 domain-containing protein n=1 Tax=Tessaracoccus palaemonis TaxID=2829499 RepID=A0ABX8SL93_9ACTN|nr:enterochelin esterase domain-containing protein [Tessaracoccus palaemonis]QXT64156.1 DUF3327 domain-containing protein [Tessaracoccus palaemonis]